MATPYMSLTLPTPSVTLGPTYASQIGTALTTIDSHNHSNGQGQQVPVSGLNINADLSLAGFNLTTARILKLQLQSVAPALNTDIGCIYATTAGDLFYRNGNGQAVQITSGSGLAAVGTGSISGLAAPATASFSSSSGAFSWRSNTNVAAGMDGGPLTIRDTGASALGITFASPAGIAAAYQLTLPSALPSNAGLLSVGTTGALSVFATVSGTDLTIAGNLTVTGATITLVNAPQTVKSSATNSSLTLQGNRNATDAAGTDVILNSTATRTAGLLCAVANNGTGKFNVDYQGLATLASQAAPLQPASLYSTITPSGTWGNVAGGVYWKDAVGVVHLRGGLSQPIGGGATNPLATLPAGFRPTQTAYFNGVTIPNLGGSSATIVQITSAGAVNLLTSLGAQLDTFYLDAITFAAAA